MNDIGGKMGRALTKFAKAADDLGGAGIWRGSSLDVTIGGVRFELEFKEADDVIDVWTEIEREICGDVVRERMFVMECAMSNACAIGQTLTRVSLMNMRDKAAEKQRSALQ